MLQFRDVRLPQARQAGGEAKEETESAFDELLLAVYSPTGVHVYRHEAGAPRPAGFGGGSNLCFSC